MDFFWASNMTNQKYKTVSISDGSFAVVIMSDHELPKTVSSFKSKSDAEEWVSHQSAVPDLVPVLEPSGQ
jgi:hypothetical protein